MRRHLGPLTEPGELRGQLAAPASVREAAERTAERAHEMLARSGTEALMAGRSLREVADATGYSASTVQRHRLHDVARRAGWYRSITRAGMEQYWDGRRWRLEFRSAGDTSSETTAQARAGV